MLRLFRHTLQLNVDRGACFEELLRINSTCPAAPIPPIPPHVILMEALLRGLKVA